MSPSRREQSRPRPGHPPPRHQAFNLLLDTRGTVWATDFGLAKASDQADLTQTGDLLGTLRYMPPEAFEGTSDARGDVYALGLTLYELLALRPAFGGRDRGGLVLTRPLQTSPAAMRGWRRLNRSPLSAIHRPLAADPPGCRR